MPSSLPVPTEHEEQRILVQWLRVERLPHFRVPNETFTKSWAQKSINAALGVVRGVPDLFVVIPPDRSIDGRGYFIALEMKCQRGSTVSPEQRQWNEALNGLETPQVAAYAAKGAREAISIVERYLSVSRHVTMF